jgi:hypothetical protein
LGGAKDRIWNFEKASQAIAPTVASRHSENPIGTFQIIDLGGQAIDRPYGPALFRAGTALQDEILTSNPIKFTKNRQF